MADKEMSDGFDLLRELALDLGWSWNHGTDDIFRSPESSLDHSWRWRAFIGGGYSPQERGPSRQAPFAALVSPSSFADNLKVSMPNKQGIGSCRVLSRTCFINLIMRTRSAVMKTYAAAIIDGKNTQPKTRKQIL